MVLMDDHSGEHIDGVVGGEIAIGGDMRRVKWLWWTLPLPMHCQCVVMKIVDCLLPCVHVVGDDVVLGNGPSQFRVTVRDGASGVVERHCIALNFSGKRSTP